MIRYNFSQDWFSSDDLKTILPINTNKEIHVLEIGSFEGKSTVWFIENILKNNKSSITCIDPWVNFIQNENSIETYTNKIVENPPFNIDFIQQNIKQTFLQNIENTGHKSKVQVIQGLSHEELPKLLSNKLKFDIIFIDGNHTAPFVLTDSIMSWFLLKNGGIMIFDDYLWNPKDYSEINKPKMAIDSFISIFSEQCSVILDDYRKAIIKK
jgi:predicted O-methyltransferase YrrM